MSIVYDFEDIARRMNRKPEVPAKVEMIALATAEEVSAIGPYHQSGLPSGLATNNALLKRLYEAAKVSPPRSQDREDFLRKWEAVVLTRRGQNVLLPSYNYVGVDWAGRG